MQVSAQNIAFLQYLLFLGIIIVYFLYIMLHYSFIYIFYF